MSADREYLAAGLVLGGLSQAETEEAHRLFAEDAVFRADVSSFEDTMGVLAETDQPLQPSEETAAAILAIPHKEPRSAAENPGPTEERPSAQSEQVRRRSPAVMALALAASTLFVIAAVLGGLVVNQFSERDQLEEQLTAAEAGTAQMERLLGAGDLSTTTAEVTGGGEVTVSYSVNQQLMRVDSADVAAPEDGEDLQMWIIDDDGAHSAGLMSPDEASMISQPAFEEGTAFGVTVEPAGGSEEPTSDPIVVAEL